MADNTITVEFIASLTKLDEGIQEAKTRIESITEPVTSLANSFRSVGEAIGAAFAVETIEKIGEFVEKTVELGDRMSHLSQEIGVTVEQAGGFAFAAGAMGVSIEQSAHALERLENSMVQAASGVGKAAGAFQALGIDVKEPSGELKSLDDILPELANKFEQSRNGPEKTAIAIALLGRAGADMIPFLNKGAEGLAEMKRIGEETGSVMSGQVAEGFEQTKIKLYELGKAWEGLSITIMARWKSVVDHVIESQTLLLESINKLLHVDTSADLAPKAEKLWASLEKADEEVTKLKEKMAQSGLSPENAAKLFGLDEAMKKADSLRAQYNELIGLKNKLQTDENAAANAESSDAAKPKLPALDATGGKSQISQYQAELTQKLMADKNYFKDATAESLKFWTEKLQTAKLTNEEINTINSKIYALEKSLAVDAAHTEIATLNEKQAAAKDNYAQIMALEEQKLAFLKSKYGTQSVEYQTELTHQVNMKRQHNDQLLRADIASLNEQQAAAKNHYDQVLALEDKKLSELARRYTVDSEQYKNELKHRDEIVAQHNAEELRMAIAHSNSVLQQQKSEFEDEKSTLEKGVAATSVAAQQKFDKLRQLANQIANIDIGQAQNEQKLAGDNVAAQQRAADRIAEIRRNLAHNITSIDNEQAREADQLEKINTAGELALSAKRITVERDALSQDVALHFKTIQEKLAAERQYDAQIYSMSRERLLQAMNDNQTSVADKRKYYFQLEELDLDYNQKLRKNSFDTVQANTAVFRQFAQVLVGSVGSAISGLIFRTETLQQAVQNIFRSMINFVIEQIERMVLNWIESGINALAGIVANNTQIVGNQTATLATMTASQEGYQAQSLSLQTASIAAQKGLAITAGFGQIAIDAAVAAAGAAAMVPFPPPATIAASTEAFAYTMGWAAGLGGGGLAVGAWEIPKDMATNLHQGEMVIPATFAEGLRSGTQGLGGASASGSGGGNHYSINIQALDAKSVKQLFMDNGGALVNALSRQKRNLNSALG